MFPRRCRCLSPRQQVRKACVCFSPWMSLCSSLGFHSRLLITPGTETKKRLAIRFRKREFPRAGVVTELGQDGYSSSSIGLRCHSLCEVFSLDKSPEFVSQFLLRNLAVHRSVPRDGLTDFIVRTSGCHEIIMIMNL